MSVNPTTGPTQPHPTRRRGALALALGAAALAVAAVAAFFVWRSNATRPGGGDASTGPQKPAVLVVSGDTHGWITPCGCTSNQSGGLPRRGSYLAKLRATRDVIYADAGGAAAGDSPYQRVKFEAILAGERAMGLAAHNVGKSEAALGAEYLRTLAARTATPLVSANVRGRDGGPVAAPYRVVRSGGRRIALTGVLSPAYASAAADCQITDPRQAVLDALAAAKGEYDAAVVLAYVPEDELDALARGLPEAAAVVGGPTGQAVAPKPAGPVTVAAATNKGKFLIELDVPPDNLATAWAGRVVEMGPALADDPAQQQNVKTYLATLARRDFPASQTDLVPPLPPGAPEDYRVAGSATCVTCHADTKDVWAHSRHAHASESLRPRGFHVDPTCLQCHTTGYGQPGGFQSVSTGAGLDAVGCESCHGPSLAHTRNPTSVRPAFAARDQCKRCHDLENSPKFDYPTYWPRVKHGRESARTEAVTEWLTAAGEK